jgi:hypothetical protein
MVHCVLLGNCTGFDECIEEISLDGLCSVMRLAEVMSANRMSLLGV